MLHHETILKLLSLGGSYRNLVESKRKGTLSQNAHISSAVFTPAQNAQNCMMPQNMEGISHVMLGWHVLTALHITAEYSKLKALLLIATFLSIQAICTYFGNFLFPETLLWLITVHA